MQQIKKNYNPIYNNVFGKVKVFPNKRTFFKQPSEDHLTLSTIQNIKILSSKALSTKSRPQSAQFSQTSLFSQGGFSRPSSGTSSLRPPPQSAKFFNKGTCFDSLDFYKATQEYKSKALDGQANNIDYYELNGLQPSQTNTQEFSLPQTLQEYFP